MEYVLKIVQDEELLEYIAENTYNYYIAQNTDTAYTKSLQKNLADVEKSISNLVKAIEQGIFNEATKQCSTCRQGNLSGEHKNLKQ